MEQKIDVIILTNNEEDVIEDAIKSVRDLASNILIVDSGSTDKTVEIAKKYKVKIEINKLKNFSDQRNFALKKVNSPWVYYLDADERATDKFKEELKDKINKANDNTGGFIVERKTFYYGKDWGFSDKVARVFKLDKFKKWSGEVHETPHCEGELKEIRNPILHYTHRNLEQMLRKTNKWSEYEAKMRFENNHPKMKAWRFLRVMFSEFVRSYIKEKGFKNGTHGLIEAIYQSYSVFITYAKLWEIQTKKN